MKKVLFILPWLAVGGLEKMQVNLANALVSRGYDVTVMALQPKADLLPQLDKSVKYVHKPYKPHPIMKRIPYIRHKFYDDGMWEKRASPKTLYKYYVGSEKYDVEIAFFRGLPIKIISGSTDPESVKLAWVHSDFRRAKGYDYEFRNLSAVHKAYKSFDKVVCVSNEANEGFREVIGDTENLITIYNFIPCDKIIELSKEETTAPMPQAKLQLILVGRLFDGVKGQVRLIKAVSRFKREGYDLSRTLVGGGPDEELIKNTIEENDACKFVFMVGSQDNPYPFIVRSDLLICASYLEGYNLTVAEALALGTPVLSTACTGPNEILDYGKYGKIVENSEDGLFYGIKDLLDNPEKLECYKSKTKERIGFFDEDNVVSQITQLFGDENGNDQKNN